jgi:hypothetical protein
MSKGCSLLIDLAIPLAHDFRTVAILHLALAARPIAPQPLVGLNAKNSKRLIKIQAYFSREEIEAVEDFRFRHRMLSRASAVRRILALGLAKAEMKSTEQPRVHCAKSRR